MTHTPGPWIYENYTIMAATKTPYGDIWEDIAELHRPHESMEEQGDADGKLIAAAPDMLDALQHVAEWCDLIRQNYPEMWNDFKAVKPAIQQATGGA